MAYFGTHNHSEYSNITTGLDCINRIKELVNKAKEIGLSGIAITDHDNLCQVIEINRLQKELRKNNDDFVLAQGNEIYLVDEYDSEVNNREKYYHFILIAKDKIGFDALVELSSKAWYRSSVKFGKRRVPTLKSDLFKALEKAKGHLIGTTACIGGEAGYLVSEQNYDKLDEFLKTMSAAFGKDDFYIELQPAGAGEQQTYNNYMVNHYKDNYNFLVATDAHYQNKEDFDIFEAFLRSQNEKREVKEYYDDARLMTEEEIREKLFGHGIDQAFIEKCLQNTLKIGSQIEFYDLAQVQRIPNMPLKDIEIKVPQDLLNKVKEYPTLSWALTSSEVGTRYCIQYCLNSMYEKNIFDKEHLDRLEEEFEVHKYQSDELNSNFFNYVNVIQWVINLAWSIDCAVGPSRGSASGCLINYLMDVVQNDPLKYDLKFWRYLNKVRTSPLDIDTDFQPSKRPELFEAIRKERGELGMTQVATYRTLTLKSAINSAGRGYRSEAYPNGLDADITRYLSSLIEVRRGAVATLKQTLEGDETTGFSVNKNFIKECKQFPGFLDIVKKIEGLIVGSSTHAAAVILFDDQDRLIDHCSLMRAPNGDLCTALDLHTVEEAGCYKYDFLLLSTLDIQSTCFKLLQQHGEIDKNLTLKECYRKYINPNEIDYSDPRIWEHLYNGDVLSIFQYDAASGRKGVLATHPQTLDEMTAVNGLIRLMTEAGEEDQIERFVRIKDDPQSFEDEMINAGVSEERRKIMHEELDATCGCAATQENFMTLVQRLVGFSLKEADALRKTVAKKKVSEINKQHDLFFEKAKATGCSEKEAEYLWKVVVKPSLGYSFARAHGLPYSQIGVQCILLGGVLFPPIYWQTACLLQRSGSLDNKSADYNKIAKAVTTLSAQGVNIAPININKSDKEFSLDPVSNTIYFGFDGVKGLKEKAEAAILELRPFNDMYDCISKTNMDVTSIVALIKGGAFDDFGSREDAIMEFVSMKADTKSRLNGQNLLMISRDGFWPAELAQEQKVFNFTQYLKKISPKEDKENYKLDERAMTFLDSINYEYSGDFLNKAEWKYYYDKQMVAIKNYLTLNQQEMLNKVNEKAMNECHDKYFKGDDIGQFEIETLGICFGQHPLAEVEGIEDFNLLTTEPMLDRVFTNKQGRTIPMYQLTMIAGCCIAKDKLHHTVTILTPTGPVDVKYRKEEFAHYDSQISKVINGKKKIIERSWFNRGEKILVHGMRQDDLFIAKIYKNSPMVHTTYKITGINDTKLEVKECRDLGNEEEDKGEE